MGAGVTAQESKWQPSAIDILRRCSYKSTHIVAPERETAQSEAQSASQVAKHAGVSGGCVAAPV